MERAPASLRQNGVAALQSFASLTHYALPFPASCGEPCDIDCKFSAQPFPRFQFLSEWLHTVHGDRMRPNDLGCTGIRLSLAQERKEPPHRSGAAHVQIETRRVAASADVRGIPP